MQSNMISVSQDEYIRMLNLLEYQAKFILKNSNVDKINKDKETVLEFLYMCNDLDITYNTYISAKNNYKVDVNYLQQLEQTKKQLNDFIYGNWDVESIIVDRDVRGRGNC